MAATIVAGDSKLYAVTLYMPGGTEAFAINPVTDSVQVAIVSLDRKTSYTQPVEASSTTAGADWEHSKIVFKFSRAATAAIDFSRAKNGEIQAGLEVQVTFNKDTSPDDWTWFIPEITLVPGNI